MMGEFTEIKKNIQRPDFITIVVLRTIGNFLILLALFLTVRTFQNPVAEEIKYLTDKITHKKYVLIEDTSIEFQKDYSLHKNKDGFNTLKGTDTIEIIKPIDPKYSIVIPKINANARVIPNVDAANRAGYLEVLKQGIAHAAGSSNPGENGHMFYFAHSTDNFWNVTRYNAIFYLLYKLEDGDDINIYYNGKRFKYVVTGHQIVEPNQVEYLTRKTSKDFVTLQTCWPLGTTFKRYLVFAQPK